MVVAEQTVYGTGAAIVFGATVIAAIQMRGLDGEIRRHVKWMPVILAILTLGYLGMALQMFVETSPDGEPVYFTRYGTYLLSYTFLMSYIGLFAGARLRYRLLPAFSVIGFTVGTVIVQLTTSPVDTLGTVLVLASLVVVFWAFFSPLTRAAAAVSDERRLLFVKLRNLASLVFVMYLLVALTNRAALGLLDAFVGVFTTAYIDIVAHIAFAGLIIYSSSAVASLSEEHPSPFEMFLGGRTGTDD